MPVSISTHLRHSSNGRMQRSATNVTGCANKRSATNMACLSHCNNRITKVASSATITDSVTFSGIARAKDRTQTRTTAGTLGQHARVFPLATTTLWTCWPRSERPQLRKTRKNTANPVDASNAVSKATSRGPVQVRNPDKIRTPAQSPLRTMCPTTCLSTAAAT